MAAGAINEDCRMSASTLRVLIVDDSRDYVDSTSWLLELWGHLPIPAYDGPSAIALAAEHQPHVILFDIAMPGMDGNTMARRLREQPGLGPSLFICISGYGPNHELAHEICCDMHLVKPAPIDTLQEILAERAAALAN
jgi:CheY-like chemotaxis protein